MKKNEIVVGGKYAAMKGFGGHAVKRVVREVTEISEAAGQEVHSGGEVVDLGVRFTTIEGPAGTTRGVCTLKRFARWATEKLEDKAPDPQ